MNSTSNPIQHKKDQKTEKKKIFFPLFPILSVVFTSAIATGVLFAIYGGIPPLMGIINALIIASPFLINMLALTITASIMNRQKEKKKQFPLTKAETLLEKSRKTSPLWFALFSALPIAMALTLVWANHVHLTLLNPKLIAAIAFALTAIILNAIATHLLERAKNLTGQKDESKPIAPLIVGSIMYWPSAAMLLASCISSAYFTTDVVSAIPNALPTQQFIGTISVIGGTVLSAVLFFFIFKPQIFALFGMTLDDANQSMHTLKPIYNDMPLPPKHPTRSELLMYQKEKSKFLKKHPKCNAEEFDIQGTLRTLSNETAP